MLILVSGATAGYTWLCAIASPLARSIHSLWSHVRDGRAWRACALASGGALLWTFLAAGGTLLLMILEPRIGFALIESRLPILGVLAGIIVWGLQVWATDRMPRLGPDFEVATALALTAMVDDDPATLARVECMYRAHAVAPRAASRRVFGLAT
jgi:hypothetical protein